jgi:tRNA(Ile2) C34 agmatinyltransferase TiaS|tara:strand:- start:3918 stop:4217 length:300 start_codon:yes stop_codon:yes gene_type:complete
MKRGIKNFGNEKYLHEECKIERRRINNKNSIKIRKENEDKIIDMYLLRVNSALVKKERNCIICNKRFKSGGNHNQICNICNMKIENIEHSMHIYKNPEI